ncbi:enoyl-CoA hydratase/isomerase family protein [Cryptosporangium sp. NPDC051539]|uniref:enoyl-CoA hydratase/isomerase family protein n=1 Tax=Cryptosporangium sp. NPDC051539 TaxID=3363962 RepID=UPI0037A8A5E1
MRSFDTLAQLGRELTGDVRVLVVEVSNWTTDLRTLTDETLVDYQKSVARLQRADLIVVTTARGTLTGLAAELALIGDLRLFAADTELALTAVHDGLVPVLGTTQRLTDLVGPARATELLLTGRPIGAPEAERLGLATTVVGLGELDPAPLAEALRHTDRDALTEIKALMSAVRHHDPLTAEREAFLRLTAGDT